MKQKLFAFWVGIFMLLAVLAFIFMAFKVSGLTGANPFVKTTYNVSANFTDIGGLKVRSAVRVAGVQIGTVEQLKLNSSTYQADVIMAIKKGVKIPVDSSASVTASGILGDNFISISPGYSTQSIANNGTIQRTYAATNISSLISTFMSGGKKP